GVRHKIAGGYKLHGNNQVGVEMAAYDPTSPLVIDPALVYSTYLGGSGEDVGRGIAVDSSGNAYVTGGTISADFPTTTGALQTGFRGNRDAFVAKLNAAGNGLVYSTYLAGGDSDLGLGISVDSSGNAYVTGFTLSADFPTTTGALRTANVGGGDAFVTKLNAA